MLKNAFFGLGMLVALALPISGDTAIAQDADQSEATTPPEHTEPFPNLGTGRSRKDIIDSFELAPQLNRGVPARELLQQRRRLTQALSSLQPQRPGTVDAYVVTIALDSDPVFAREAREAGTVLSRRYDGVGRTVILAGPDGARDDLPRGSIETLLVTLAHIAEVLDKEEDVLVLYSTSHGNKIGLAYHYGDTGYGVLSPARLKAALEDLGIERRILVINACYSGVFVPALQSDNTAILTAASSERNSFGCQAENDWTFFGDALINNAMREPQSLSDAALAASRTVAEWEADRRLLASLPQRSIGASVSDWLPALEARMPQTATQPVGRPAIGE